MAQTMDDMVFQCSNQNSIYVLNASYGAYGDYGTYAATKREINGSRSRAANPIEATCSSGVLQHKFKTFGSAAAAAATTMAMDAAAAGSASNYVNPVATSMSTAMCSPATAALQKLFNCSVGVACQNVTHAHSNHSSSNISSSNISSSSNTNSSSSNNNAAASNHNNRCLSAAGGVTQNGRNRSRSGESLDGTAGVGTSTGGGAGGGPGGGAGGGAGTGGNLPLMPKKKCTNVKSALIAKKTKFLKYLEEEKWRSNAAVPEDSAGAISNEAGPPPNFGGNNNGGNLKNQSNSREAGSGGAGGNGGQLNKLTNWSMHNEDNNTATATTTALTSQQQLQLQLQQQQQQQAKSSYELYQEAADILGLSCSLCDNCRCLDCQSGYFDCDDDDESYSEQSLMDDEYDEFDCSAEELQAVLTGGGGGGVPIPSCCLPHKGDSPASAAHTALTNVESLGHRLAIDFDLINATCSQVLENCETFNDLSLLDAGGSAGSGVEQRPFT